MTTTLWLLALLGVIGAFDTIYYHEYRGRLVARPAMRPELRLHVARDALYVVIFCSLPLVAWHGWWAAVLALILLAEVVITLADFVTEDTVRADLGGVFPGERITHAVMGIVYGGVLAFLLPQLWTWWGRPTGLVAAAVPVPTWLTVALVVGGIGTGLHGLRDLAAVRGLPASAWPWVGARAPATSRTAPIVQEVA